MEPQEIRIARFVAECRGIDLGNSSPIEQYVTAEIIAWVMKAITAAARHPEWAFRMHGEAMAAMPELIQLALTEVADELVKETEEATGQNTQPH